MSEVKSSLDKVYQTINLNEIVGSDISGDEELVLKMGQAIIDYMGERVDEGLGLGRKKLKSPYSVSYAESLNFKAAGKSKSQVNMRLSGDMLSSIDILETSGAKITIGIEGSEAHKAFNHQTGDTVPKREFFGVTTAEIKKHILDEFKPLIELNRKNTTGELNKVIENLRGKKTLADLLGGL